MSSYARQNGNLDQQFAIFLNPIKDLSQNWEIDISKILDDYLEKIDGIEKNFQDRSPVLSFTEAAMVIQGSVNIYSRKVEYFEKIILQVLSDFGSSQVKNIMEKDSPNDRKERVRNLNDFEFKKINDIQSGKNIEMVNDDDDNYMKKNNFKFLPAVLIQLTEKENNTMPGVELFEKGEFISAKADFYLNHCCLTPGGSLSSDPPRKYFKFTMPQDAKMNNSLQSQQPALVFQDCNESFNDALAEAHDL
ncbi:unnamed protein product, partial [Meganyctiphanes norvegica]